MINGLLISNGRIRVYHSGHELSRKQSRNAFYQICDYQRNYRYEDSMLQSLFEMHPREN